MYTGKRPNVKYHYFISCVAYILLHAFLYCIYFLHIFDNMCNVIVTAIVIQMPTRVGLVAQLYLIIPFPHTKNLLQTDFENI